MGQLSSWSLTTLLSHETFLYERRGGSGKRGSTPPLPKTGPEPRLTRLVLAFCVVLVTQVCDPFTKPLTTFYLTVKTGIIGPHAKTSRIPSFGLGGKKYSEKTVFQPLHWKTNKKKKRQTLLREAVPTS